MSSPSKKYFYKNGKKILNKKIKEPSLGDRVETIGFANFSLGDSISTLVLPKRNFIFTIKHLPRNIYLSVVKPKLHLENLRAGVVNLWASVSVVVIFSFLISLMVTPQKARPQDSTRYAVYSSRPLTLQPSTTSVYSKDSRAQRINEVFKMYNCPLEGLGDTFVYEADKNDIPWWLVASVSFKESTCGKYTPKVGGEETYNAWGWAVYGSMKFSFDNWSRGIETVSKYFGTRFFSQGITDTCEIMKVYTPQSDGSWCEDVNYFANIIQDFKTLED